MGCSAGGVRAHRSKIVSHTSPKVVPLVVALREVDGRVGLPPPKLARSVLLAAILFACPPLRGQGPFGPGTPAAWPAPFFQHRITVVELSTVYCEH
jgi:hypothetical protein